MRLKIRHVTRRSEEERDDHFNPINLDYIFDEDDPLSPWLQEREHARLDDEDNSIWLDMSDDEQNPVDLSGNSSSGGRGLSSSRSGGDIGGSGGQNEIRKHVDGNRVSHTTYHDEDDGIRGSTQQQQRHSVSGDDVGSLRTNRRSRPLGDFYNNHDNLGHRFGQLGVGQDQCQPHNLHWQPPPYPNYPPPERQPFLNQLVPPYMGMGYPYQSHHYPYSESSSYGSNTTFGLPGNNDYSQQESNSSVTTNKFDHCNFTSNYYGSLFEGIGQHSHGDCHNNQENVDPPVPPRKSFWY